ncbi:MAG: 50S ribosomal protein L6 [Firmicutes bacterium]|nr:50S ribosomal protein L6 [Bacillota bacterium]
MSRIGKKPIPLPSGVSVEIDGALVKVKGPKGELSQEIPGETRVRQETGQIIVERSDDSKRSKSLHGLVRTLVANMVEGVSNGFTKTLEIHGVGYRATMQGNKLVLNVGYSQPVEIDPFTGVEITVPAPNKIVVQGIDKQKVGEMAAIIRRVRKPEPYKGKGIRYENEYVRRKAGKAGKAGK